jgi:hypothetical protein
MKNPRVTPEERILLYRLYSDVFKDGLEISLFRELHSLVNDKNLLLSKDFKIIILRSIENILTSWEHYEKINPRDIKEAFKELKRRERYEKSSCKRK